MAKKPRSPERAVQVVERAAKMSKFKPGLFDRDFAGDRMRSPGLGKVSFDYNTIDPARVRATGIKDVPLKDLVTDQPTVSIKTLKDKLLNPSARNSSALPKALLDPKTGKYVIPDGVHRRAVAAALGQTSMRVATGEVMRQPLAPAAAKAPSMSPAGRAGLALAAVGPVVAAVNGYNRVKAAGGDPADAVVQGMRDATTMAAVGAVSAGAFTGLAAAARAVAPRVAPMLGPVGWVAAAGMAAYGATQGYRASGTMVGALKGAVGLDAAPISTDVTTAALARVAPMQVPTSSKAAGSGNLPASGRMSKAQAAQFEKTEAARSRAPAQATPADGNTRRGFQNPANMQAALAAQGRDWSGQYQNLNLTE